MILVTGADGYIGRALILELLTVHKQQRIIGVDNFARRKWVEEVKGDSFFPLDPIRRKRYKLIRADLSNYKTFYRLIKKYKPQTIIHLASQPSMPYSQIDTKHAVYTQVNNLNMSLGLLWAVKELSPKTRIIVTTTTGIPGQAYEKIPEEPTINAAGSWYHVSRGFDSANMSLAARQWGLQIVEFRTSIVFGARTDALYLEELFTRFDTDFYFGTALNRFVMQKMSGQPITVYGKGNQVKPFVSLDDCVRSLVRASYIDFPKGHTILNQVTEHMSIRDLAHLISRDVKHIPNPRKENENFKMTFDNKKFLKVLGRPARNKQVVIEELIGDVKKQLS